MHGTGGVYVESSIVCAGCWVDGLQRDGAADDIAWPRDGTT